MTQQPTRQKDDGARSVKPSFKERKARKNWGLLKRWKWQTIIIRNMIMSLSYLLLELNIQMKKLLNIWSVIFSKKLIIKENLRSYMKKCIKIREFKIKKKTSTSFIGQINFLKPASKATPCISKTTETSTAE